MIKIILSMLLVSSVIFGATPLGKATGCDLSQNGDVTMHIGGYATSKKADYKAIKEVGKTFKELFVGSTIQVKDALVTITAITSNKRVRGKPRTGVVTISLKQNNQVQNIEMPYTYLDGHFQAKGKQKNSKEISFALEIKALLCYSK